MSPVSIASHDVAHVRWNRDDLSGEVIMQTLTSTIQLSRHSRFGLETLVFAALAATLLTSSIAAPDGPPKLNVGPSCQAAARNSISAGRDKDACMADERVSEDQVTKNWSQYAPDDKTQCVGMNRKGGPSSYVELLSCLEIMRDAKIIRKDQLLADPLFNKGVLNTRTLLPTDPREGNLYTDGGKKMRRAHKRNHRE